MGTAMGMVIRRIVIPATAIPPTEWYTLLRAGGTGTTRVAHITATHPLIPDGRTMVTHPLILVACTVHTPSRLDGDQVHTTAAGGDLGGRFSSLGALPGTGAPVVRARPPIAPSRSLSAGGSRAQPPQAT